MSYSSPSISIIIATYNRPKSLLRLLDNLNDQRCVDFKNIDVCVVNDGGTYHQFGNYKFRFDFVNRERAPDNTSRVYSSRNIAAQHTSGEYILQLDDDLEFSPYLLNLLQSTAGTAGEHWVWCARISNNTDVDKDGVADFSRGADGRWYDGKCQWQETHWESSSSAGMFLPRRTWNAIDGYDEQFDGCMGAADQELCLRVQKLGEKPGDVKVLIAPYFVNIADEETGSWRMAMIDRRKRNARNEDLFFVKHPDRKEWTNV